MDMSYMALNRCVEERAARDESYRRGLERNRRPLLSHGRAMSGRKEEAEAVREQIKQSRKPEITTRVRIAPDSMQVRQTHGFGEEGLPLEELPNLAPSREYGRSGGGGSFQGRHRVGRNDPCPCGSGKKFKKCCARKPR